MEQQDNWCWWCCHSFTNTPIGFPYKYDERCDRFYTLGRFCSFPCVKAFNLDSDSSTKGINAMWIFMMKKRATRSMSPIRCAPRRWCLKEFGGSMTIEEFRKSDTDKVWVDMPNEIRRMPEVHLSTGPTQSTSSPSTSEELVLKRPKPLKREQSLLEKSLCLTRKCQSGSSTAAQKSKQ